MGDYLPKYKPGADITSTTSGAVTGGQLLAVSGDGTVATCGAGSTAWLGVAAFDAASGARVAIHCGGVQRLTASGGITAGDQVISAAAGKVSSLAAAAGNTAGDINAARQVVGIALTTATDGNTVEVAMTR
jgi:hypothetical protein